MKSSESCFPCAKTPLRWRWRILIGALCLGVLVCAFAVDGAVIARIDAWRHAANNANARRITVFLNAIELYAMGYITAAIAIAMLFLDRRRAARALALALIVTAVGLANNVVKQACGRARPKTLKDLSKRSMGSPIGNDADALSSRTIYFGGPAKGCGMRQSKYQSFPSGHSAAAAGQSAVLCALYPQGTAVFLLLTGLVGVERIYHEDHFPSDVWAGFLLGWLLARAMLVWRAFQRFCFWLAGLPPFRWISRTKDLKDLKDSKGLNGSK
ncbi:MAG: phosphatase PAP2 family protein [Candidatus Sumerlaeota bacterium]|nr:phosphatase PAP2 family protein [Candidatus Sumerlaeota bacterium]